LLDDIAFEKKNNEINCLTVETKNIAGKYPGIENIITLIIYKTKKLEIYKLNVNKIFETINTTVTNKKKGPNNANNFINKKPKSKDNKEN
jgi:hypothetical protein